MNLTTRLLIALILPALVAAGLPAQTPLSRGPLHDTSAARSALAAMVADAADRDILLITVDSVVLDLLPIYGKNSPPMPHFEAFANESTTFLNAWAPSPNRSSAAIGLHHSIYPTTAVLLGATEKSASLASRLADGGFSPYAIARREFLESDENVGSIDSFFDIDDRAITSTRNPATMLERFSGRLTDRRSGERLFGWIHLELTWPPATYHPGFEASGSFENHYRAALQSTDAFLGDLARAMAEAKTADRTIVILAGLHGMSDFQAPGRGLRQSTLEAKSLRVPLLVHVAGLKPARILAPVETLDIAPSLLELAGIPVGPSTQGRSFLDLLVDPRARDGREGLVFAELLEWRGEARRGRRVFVSDGRWSLSENESGEDPILSDAQATDGENMAAANPEVLNALHQQLDIQRVYTATCADLWDRGIAQPIAVGQPLFELGRARFLARNGKKTEAAATLGRLVMRDGEHLETTLEVAIENEIDTGSIPVKELLQHPRARVRGLAGAWLAMKGKSEAGIEQAISVLGSTADASVLRAILTALGRSDSPRARDAIKKLDVTDDELAACRDLALVRLGDTEAVSRLPQRFLTPNPAYDRRPFYDAIAERMPEKLVGLSRLYLEDGDGNPRLVRTVLERLETLNAIEAAPSLAMALSQVDADLRLEMVAQLRRWNSFAAATAALELAGRSAADAEFAARVLFGLPGLMSSSFIPSMRLDHHCARFEDERSRRIEVGACLTNSDFVEFALALEGLRAGSAVLLFQFDSTTEEPTADSMRVEVQFNDSKAWLRTEQITKYGDVWAWTGKLRPESLEAGLNKAQMRLRVIDRKDVKAHALAFVILPEKPDARHMIAGLDAKPLFGPPVLRSGSRVAGDAESYEIFMRRDPYGEIGGEIRALADGRTFARFALRDMTVPRKLELALPDWASADSLIELQAVDVPSNSGLSAVLYGLKRKAAPRPR